MDKECCQVNFTEADEGFRVDVKGLNLKDICKCGCGSFTMASKSSKSECGPSDEKK